MQSESRIIKACALALLLVASLSLISVPSDDVSAETAYDKDYGQFYSYTLQFVFDGADAQTIDWNFGDGSAHSTEWNPSHTYAEKGVYYVTQTTTNTYNGGSTTVQVYKVEVMGFPVISFDTHGGPVVDPVQQTAYNVKATAPADPARNGYEFGGWFDDPELTQAHDWDANVIASTTLHAKWTPVQTVTEFTVTFDVAGGPETVSSKTVTEGSTVTLPDYTGTLEGKEFAGWVHGSTTYQPGQSITVNADMIFTASWKDKTSEPTDPEDPENPDDEDPTDPGKDDPDNGLLDDVIDRLTGPEAYKYVLGTILIIVLLGTVIAVARRH